VFPRIISGGLSAGAKAKEAKIKKERRADNVAEKKLTGKKVRKTVLSEELEMKNTKNMNTNIAAFSAGDLVDEVEKEVVGGDVLGSVEGGVGEGEGGGEGGESSIDSTFTADTPGSTPLPAPLLTLKSASRPGITSERIQNIFDPYVTGIAVRP
jgi:hypothetical protein